MPVSVNSNTSFTVSKSPPIMAAAVVKSSARNHTLTYNVPITVQSVSKSNMITVGKFANKGASNLHNKHTSKFYSKVHK